MAKLSIEHAEQEFIALLERVEPRQVAQFLQWIGDSFSVVDGNRNAPSDEETMDVDAAKADCELRDIANEMKSILPTSAVLPSENVLWPVNGIDSDCHPNTTVHVDGFLFDENDVDDLVDQGQISRNFCRDCGSHKTAPLTFISHSLGADQLRYMFTSLVPLRSPQMAGRIVVDIGSRLGTVLYGVHYFSGGAVKAIGIEMNRDFCDLQNRFIQSKNMTNVEVICDNLLNQKDVIASADVITMNNVFSFFMPEEGQIKCWRFLAEHMKPGCVLIHNPSVESVVEHLDLGFKIPQWLDHISTEHQAALFAGSNEELFEDCEKLTMYQVRPRSQSIEHKPEMIPLIVPFIAQIGGSIALLIATTFHAQTGCCTKKKPRAPPPFALGAVPIGGSLASETTTPSSGKPVPGESPAEEKKSVVLAEEKTQASMAPTQCGFAGILDPNYQTLAGMADTFGKDKAPAPSTATAPTQGGVALTNDPNYQTLAGMNDCFGNKKKDGGSKKEEQKGTGGGVAATHDPNYQTLALIAGDCFDKKDDKKVEKKDGPKEPEKKGVVETLDPNYQTLAGMVDCFQKKDGDKKKAPKAPEKGGIVGTNDPNYQTLAGVAGDCFDKKGGAKEPEKKGVVATNDPNYQTLAGVAGDCFDKKDGKRGDKKEAPKVPEKGGIVATHDPNYQTLAGIAGDCFDKKDGPKAPEKGGIVGTNDPNYQTLAGVAGDCFNKKDDKKGAKKSGPKEPEKKGMVATYDPNYQTLAGITGDCFDKKGKK
ncbi:hypothetical protein QR680_008716 [Steinernema hermaphroditum]|uniref:Methyltransferase type 11 domain-containing protein n=1 Tax=Steinernema hermaphroditum TaxID=289476 RepID=A0AA39IJY3_9BILA|nr:hypothetical protein QR680_008716 [Steinernema hermaphroditum]